MSWFGKTSSSPIPTHPYYPLDIILSSYTPNNRSLTAIALQFGGFFSVVLTLTWIASTSRRMGRGKRLALLWFTLCGTLHTLFEGYFILNHASLASRSDLFAEAWKEYALSDSRYLTGNTLVLCAETITATVLGPVSFLTAACIWRSSAWRHPLQAIVSTSHLFSDLVYLSTSLVDMYVKDIEHCRPEPLYFWFYFLFLNGIWLVVPSMLLYQSSTAMVEVFVGWQGLVEIYQEQEEDETDKLGKKCR